MTDESPTARLKIIAPGFAWLPRFLREKLTPALVGGAVVALGGGLAYFFNSPQKDINRVETMLTKSITHLEQQLDQALKELRENGEQQAGMREQQAAMKTQLNAMTDEMKRYRDWREEIAREAAAPPHSRRRK